MERAGSGAWRLAFVAAGALILAGGPQHPRDATMAEMLANPTWVRSHLLVLGGFIALTGGLALYARTAAVPARTRPWLRWAVIGTALQTVEMAFHTAAIVDHGHLVAGQPTPVLTTHLVLSVVLYPVFGATMIAFIVAAARDGLLGAWWIGWLGVLGAAAHGLSAPLVLLVQLPGARILFPMVMLVALWMVLAGVWPARAAASARASLATG